jgi:hypothetical protein
MARTVKETACADAPQFTRLLVRSTSVYLLYRCKGTNTATCQRNGVCRRETLQSSRNLILRYVNKAQPAEHLRRASGRPRKKERRKMQGRKDEHALTYAGGHYRAYNAIEHHHDTNLSTHPQHVRYQRYFSAVFKEQYEHKRAWENLSSEGAAGNAAHTAPTTIDEYS